MIMARKCWFLATLGLGLALSGHASELPPDEAECTPKDATTTYCDESELILEHVLVTATRRETPVYKVPLSVTVLSGETLQAMGAASFEDYARSVPGLSFTSAGFGGNRYIIRGVASFGVHSASSGGNSEA